MRRGWCALRARPFRCAPGCRYLASANGIRLGDAEETIRATVVSNNAYESIGAAPGNPLLVLERVVCCADRRPIEWRIGYCNFTTQSYAVSL